MKSNSSSWKPASINDVLQHPVRGFPADARQLEAVSMQVQRMDGIARIAKPSAGNGAPGAGCTRASWPPAKTLTRSASRD